MESIKINREFRIAERGKVLSATAEYYFPVQDICPRGSVQFLLHGKKTVEYLRSLPETELYKVLDEVYAEIRKRLGLQYVQNA